MPQSVSTDSIQFLASGVGSSFYPEILVLHRIRTAFRATVRDAGFEPDNQYTKESILPYMPRVLCQFALTPSLIVGQWALVR